MLTVITPTGARPEAFAECVRQMAAQDYSGPVRWIVVDDGPEAMPTPEIEGWEVLHIRPEPLWEPGQNTQARNILAGLEHIGPDDLLVMVEDDDQYAPWWLKQCAEWLETDDLVGEGGSVYVKRTTGERKEMGNTRHASLCATAMKGAAIEWLREVCMSYHKLIDIRLWKHGGKVHPHDYGVIGVKCWPGRPGIGCGHR